jgi:hypothetical protein
MAFPRWLIFSLKLNPATVQLLFHRSFFPSVEEYKELLPDRAGPVVPGMSVFENPLSVFKTLMPTGRELRPRDGVEKPP